MMNTAIEALVDLVSPQFDQRAGKIKDIAAGAIFTNRYSCSSGSCLYFWQ